MSQAVLFEAWTDHAEDNNWTWYEPLNVLCTMVR